jgi:hypothetical protein
LIVKVVPKYLNFSTLSKASSSLERKQHTKVHANGGKIDEIGAGFDTS